jgi:hypothetical protein
LLSTPSLAQAQTQVDVAELFARAIKDQRTGLARKTKPVDVRPARLGEIVATVIAGEGKETQSPPAEPGDMVVRNRCPATDNEEILVKAEKFGERYEGPIKPADGAGWFNLPPSRQRNALFYCSIKRRHIHFPGAVG